MGGGWTNAGLTGVYYNNTTLTAPASFTRKDVRIDFDWGTTIKPGGSTSPGFRDIGTDNYSIQWTGQVIPRFGETYTFKAFADDTFMLEMKPSGGSTWTTVINQPAYTGSDSTGTMALTAGQAYDVRITYKEFTSAASVRLRWTSPSTPEEVIDPLTQSGINNPDWTAGYTDIVKGARNTWNGVDSKPAPTMDAQGWPQGDGSYVFQESLNQGLDVDPLMRGTISFSFTGKADVSIQGNVSGSSLTYSYNSGTNTTTGSFSCINNGWNASMFYFRNSTRTGLTGGPGGITNLKMMRPTAPDATTSYSTDTIFTPQLESAISNFTVIRHQLVANQQRDWSDRTGPAFFNQSGGTITNPYYGVGDPSNNGAAWEYKIMLSNETGRDMMISIPTVASSAYLTNLADLIKYGSDATGTPYTTATANPAYPPLNPNLRVYLELENELWNWSSVFNTDWQNLNKITAADADANNANFQIINYDSLPTTKDGSGNYNSMGTWRFRKAVLTMVQASNTFRSVFGDSAMPSTAAYGDARIRPLYEWQYDNQNDTARLGLAWAEKYFNNSDGVTHSATPHPINYYLWGGGGAAYYGAVNGNGLTNLPSDNSFDATAVSNGYNQNPSGTIFTFTGAAGIARDTGSSDDIPTPLNGSQVGYVTDTGSISFNFTVPSTQTSNVYGFSFKAVNRTPVGTGTADKENVRIYLDDTIDITAKTYSQGNGYTPPGYDSNNPWKANNVFWTWSDYYFSKSFNLTAGSNHKITIKGMGDISGTHLTNQTVLIDDIRIISVDKIFADGIPGGGEANGQPVGQNIQNTMNVEADWAKAFGLEELSYESGWSLGGDDGGSWVQLSAKYGDSRTATAQTTFMNYFYQAGSAVNVFGTYAQWPNWSDYYAQQGLLNPSSYPIVQGIDNEANALAAEPTNGVLGPSVLRMASACITDNANATSGQITAAGGWINWMVIAPQSGYYTLSLSTTGTGGTAAILADSSQVATGATGGSAISGTVFLTKGNHSIRVLAKSGTSFTVSQVTVAGQNAPAAPTLNSAADGDGSASLSWGSVSGATGYVVRYGSASGVYSSRIDVGNVTSYTITSLTNNQQYFLAVDAYNANGESLPSNEKGVIPLAAGQQGTLLFWEFTGDVGNETSVPVSGSTSHATVSTISRGSGLKPTSYLSIAANTFGSEASDNVYGSNLAGAITKNQYYQFTITAVSGSTLSLNSLAFLPYFQNAGGTGDPRGAGITYSTDGVNFSSGIAATGTPSGTGSPFSVALSGQSSLQNTSATVTVRIYLFGNGAYEYTGIGGSGNDIAITGAFNLVATVPAAPTGLSTNSVSSSQINLTWTDNAGNETGYKVDRATNSTFTAGLTTFTLGANTTSYSDTGLSASTTYYYRVYAYNGSGNSGYSNTANATTQAAVPNAPSGLSATATSSSQINLAWTDNSSNETGFKVDRATDSGFTAGLTTFALGANVTSYSDTGLSASTTYYYRVYAYNGSGNSGYSNTANATTQVAVPNAPSGLSATATSSSQINLAWTDNSSNETGFKVDRATDSGFTQGLTTFTLGANTTSYSDTGLTANTTYYYRVYAYNGAGNSAYSATASATTQQTGGTNVPLNNAGFETGTTSGWVGGGQVWGVNNAAPHTGSYNGYNQGGWNSMFQNVTVTPNTSYTLTAWARLATATAGNNHAIYVNNGGTEVRSYISGTTYAQYTVLFTTGATTTSVSVGEEEVNGTSLTAYFDDFVLTTGTITAPAAPSGLSAAAVSSSQINLTWTDNANNETGYKVDRATDSAFTQNLNTFTLAANSTSYSDTGLAAATTYYYRVYATNSAGNSAYSATASATTQAAVPAAPTNATASAVSSSQINLTWTDNANNETGYKIDRATDAAFNVGLTTISLGANVTSYNNTGLSAGTTYYYRVYAYNGAGNSAYSNVVNAVTQAAPANLFTANGDIGSPGAAGSSSFASGTYTVKGAGADIWGTSDAFQFDYRDIAGDGTAIARVASVQNTNGWAKAGVMFRDGIAANAMFVTVEVTPSSGVSLQWRASTGGSCGSTTVTGKTAPQWVKLVRSGNSFSGYYSADGNTWTQIGTAQTVTIASAAKVGLNVTSHAAGTLCTATFDNVSVSGTAAKMTGTAIGTPGSWNNQGNDITKVFDGDLNTFFDAPDANASNGWVGLDLGSPKLITQIKFAPRPGLESRMLGGKFQVSNTADFSSGVVDLYVINTTPTAGVLTTINVNPLGAYRYIRYVGPANSWCNIAEMEVWGI